MNLTILKRVKKKKKKKKKKGKIIIMLLIVIMMIIIIQLKIKGVINQKEGEKLSL